MKRVFLIGIGPGDPKYLTVEAIETMRKVDVFFLFDKPGRGKDELVDIRKSMLEKYARAGKYRVVSAPDPERDREGASYEAAVADWRNRKRDVMAGFIKDELHAGETGAFLIWGDPCLYDGSIDMLRGIRERGDVEFDFEVVPGISSVQALVQKHKIPLNRAGEAVEITTGRRLAGKTEYGAGTIAVLLDQKSALKDFFDADAELYWGAYLGTKDEMLLSGKLGDVAAEYDRMKTQAREAKGWIMDTYILRKRKPAR